MDIINKIDQEQLRDDIPDFKPGDTVSLAIKIKEGEKERVQPFEGVVIKRQGSGARETFTVRKYSHGVGVERTFPLHSPSLASIKVLREGDVSRSKLYYLRERRGKAARVQEKRRARLMEMEDVDSIEDLEAAEFADIDTDSGAEETPESEEK